MTDVIVGIALTAVLVILFSALGYSSIPMQSYGVVPQYRGDSGAVRQGGGDLVAQEDPGLSDAATVPATEASVADRGERSSTSDKSVTPESLQKKEETSMNDILVAFWHGVATVLIGETCALAVAAAWLRMRAKELNQSAK